MEKENLDFIVIGAQKSGTTTLFEYLSRHPDLYLPLSKEAHYFSVEKNYSKGWQWYLDTFFKRAPDDKLWGTVTPSYMSFPQSAERISLQCPNIKIIAILREPISRARSHYKMALKRGIESRTFEEAIREQLIERELEQQRETPDQRVNYVVRGEYGRILSKYYKYFKYEQVLVIILDELQRDPSNILRKVYDFLGVKASIPENIGRVYHSSSEKSGVPALAKIYHKTPFLRWALKLLPQSHRYWALWRIFSSTDGKSIENSKLNLTDSTICTLRQLYNQDVRLLEKLIGRELPWNNIK